MALTITLAQWRQSLKIRAGMNTTGVSVDLTSEVLDEIINDAIFEGYDIIVNKWLDYYTVASTTAVVAGTDAYAVPTDFYKLRVLWIQDGTRWVRLYPADLDAAHVYTDQSVPTRNGYKYRIMARNIVLMPVPAQAETLKLYYIPIQPTLVSDSDSVTLDVPIERKLILAIGWRDILDRQNLDPSPAIQKIDTYTKQLRTAADSRDGGEPFYLSAMGPRRDGDDWDDGVW